MAKSKQTSSSEGSLPLLDIDLIRTFVVIAETRSFTRAARQVFRTTAALSMQIKRLEQMLNNKLLVRDSRQVHLTEAGELLLTHGRRLLKLNQETVAQFLSPNVEGIVRFGTSDDVGSRILPSVLTRLAHSHPAVQVDVVVSSSSDLLGRLDDDDLDLALVTAGNESQDPKRGRVVRVEPLVWAALEGSIAVRRSPLPLALASHGCVWRNQALAAMDTAGFPYRIAYSAENIAGQEAAILADLAVSAFPLSLVKPPLVQVDRAIGLPPLENYQILMEKRRELSLAGEMLASYIIESLSQKSLIIK